jgi:phosphate uptake regulator
MEQQLIAAVGALWVAITTLGGAVIKYLRDDMKTRDGQWEARLTREEGRCAERITSLETKLDASSAIIREQTAAAHKQIDAQSALIAQQQQMIGALQALGKGPGS